MADNFSEQHVQGVYGLFVPVHDESVSFSEEQVQSVYGLFVPILDEAAGASAITVPVLDEGMLVGGLQPISAGVN